MALYLLFLASSLASIEDPEFIVTVVNVEETKKLPVTQVLTIDIKSVNSSGYIDFLPLAKSTVLHISKNGSAKTQVLSQSRRILVEKGKVSKLICYGYISNVDDFSIKFKDKLGNQMPVKLTISEKAKLAFSTIAKTQADKYIVSKTFSARTSDFKYLPPAIKRLGKYKTVKVVDKTTFAVSRDIKKDNRAYTFQYLVTVKLDKAKKKITLTEKSIKRPWTTSEGYPNLINQN